MEALPEKKCFKCGEVKALSDFYKHPEMLDGHVNKCKECNKLDVKLNTEKRRDYYNAYDRIRSTKPHRVEARAEYGQREEVKERKRLAARKQSAESKKRKAAAVSVNNAVRDGRMFKQPCWVCGELEVQGHHPDYDSVYDVVWLCTKHHGEVHRDFDHICDQELLSSTKKGSRWDNKETVEEMQ